MSVKNFLSGDGSSAEHVLGVMVTPQALHAVLIDRGPDGTQVERHFSRQRSSDYGGDGGYGGGAGTSVPEIESEKTTGEDFTLQIGESGGGSGEDLFMGSEFGDLEGAGGGGFGGRSATPSFSLELSDILNECRDAGYGTPAVAFCLTADDVTQLELHLPDEASEDGAAVSVEAVGQKRLLSVLSDQYEGEVSKERAAFLPMTPADDGSARFLALVGQPTDPVVSTLRTLRDQEKRLPPRGLLETEVSIYLGLASAALREAGAEGNNALVVRTGEEDTLVLFAEGPALRHSETLRSLTVEDAPETICSRVLLLQDEYGIDDVEHVFLIGGDREHELVESFEMFFSDAHVEPLRQQLPAGTAAVEDASEALTLVPAIGAALRLSGHESYNQAFHQVDLLPKKLLKRRIRVPISWPVPALMVLIAVVGAFFFFRYQDLADKERQLQQEIEAMKEKEGPSDLANLSEQELQARIDSMEATIDRYARGLETLDQLLMGSDQWSQALEKASDETGRVGGIWVESWEPQTGSVRLTGNATDRSRIVELGNRTEGKIREVTFSEIREWPVYSFTMDVPLKTGLPAVTRYLREHALEDDSTPKSAQSANAPTSGAFPPSRPARAAGSGSSSRSGSRSSSSRP